MLTNIYRNTESLYGCKYRSGQIFKDIEENRYYILAKLNQIEQSSEINLVALIGLRNGNRYVDPVKSTEFVLPDCMRIVNIVDINIIIKD